MTDRGLGIDLLGSPRKQDIQFLGLKSMEFGSEEFLGTAIGQATVEAVDAVVIDLRAQLRPTVNIEGIGAKIISVDGEEIFINLGSKTGLHPGYRFHVLPGRARALNEALDLATLIATVEVVGRISGGGQPGTSIAADDRLQFIEPPE